MAKAVAVDELTITVHVPADLPDADVEAARRTLGGATFLARLRRAVSATVRAYPELHPCRLSLGR